MVFSFLCHTVTSTPCRLLYSVVYGEDLTGTVKKVRNDCKPKCKPNQHPIPHCRLMVLDMSAKSS